MMFTTSGLLLEELRANVSATTGNGHVGYVCVEDFNSG